MHKVNEMLRSIYESSGLKAIAFGLARVFDFGATIGDSELRAIYHQDPEDLVSEAWLFVGGHLRHSCEQVVSHHGKIYVETQRPKEDETGGLCPS